ncbi:hypothetical protein [Streptomyces sp. NPDC096323]|uniref:hypothetical protein n=1 Tax=Streptomyces sp. NPDC096323 TaxID=3155822 RepID=UPI0033275FEB
MTRRPLRYLAHRTGLVCSPSLLYADVPFSNRWHRRRILARKARPMGFDHSTYFAYGVHVESPDEYAQPRADRINKALTEHPDRHQFPNVGTLTAGDYDADMLFLVTECKETALGTFAHVTPQTRTVEQAAEWTRQLTAAAAALGIPSADHSEAGWLSIPDVS